MKIKSSSFLFVDQRDLSIEKKGEKKDCSYFCPEQMIKRKQRTAQSFTDDQSLFLKFKVK